METLISTLRKFFATKNGISIAKEDIRVIALLNRLSTTSTESTKYLPNDLDENRNFLIDEMKKIVKEHERKYTVQRKKKFQTFLTATNSISNFQQEYGVVHKIPTLRSEKFSLDYVAKLESFQDYWTSILSQFVIIYF